MWLDERGRETVWKLAFQEVSFRETLRLPAMLLVDRWIHETGLTRRFTTEEDELLWKLVGDYGAWVMEGKSDVAELTALGLAWKGLGGPFGWPIAEAKLPPQFRGPIAFLLGHRHLKLQRRADALKYFSAAAVASRLEPIQPQLQSLADQEIRRLKDALHK